LLYLVFYIVGVRLGKIQSKLLQEISERRNKTEYVYFAAAADLEALLYVYTERQAAKTDLTGKSSLCWHRNKLIILRSREKKTFCDAGNTDCF
jgi:hypothetical protein